MPPTSSFRNGQIPKLILDEFTRELNELPAGECVRHTLEHTTEIHFDEKGNLHYIISPDNFEDDIQQDDRPLNDFFKDFKIY